ncbi:DgyrCDS746 [Dimorphilus gyrociliatus]|uniref:DgyrCDS746 n=1 Tax=Dimorphilus gyrociliatus TaxID=2664684 RepID=A0A7I8V731_9ANNE|nr:DgyrCDS746 [Dimorphilus gyrociliatus]
MFWKFPYHLSHAHTDHWKSCNDGEKTREDGTTWRKPRSCEICKCHSGKVLCEAEKCPQTDHCKWNYNKPESCCSICAGCIVDGKYWKNFQTWMTGSCEKCACNDGIVSCKTFQCPPVECLNPIRHSDRCCPTCPQSLVKPEEIPCPLHCPNGYDKDSLGRDLCACAPLFLCNPISHCSLSCEFGFKKDEFNCEICECRKCKQLTPRCQKLACPYGLARDLLGCEMCACLSYLQADRTSNHNLITVTSAASVCAGNGLYLEDGQTFVDGCKKCLCESGRLLCTVLTCPTAKCAHPVVKADKCCPQCPDKPLLNTNKTATCATLRKDNDSSTWSLDECTICTCREGYAWCHVKECPPLTCTHPTRKEGECCLQCSNSQSTVKGPSLDGHDCGLSHKDGDSWRENACTSCSCVDGRIICYVHVCPELQCEEALLLEGRCCPFCASYRIATRPTPFTKFPTTYVEIQTTVDKTSSVTQKMSSSITKRVRNPSVDTDLIPKTTNPDSLKSSWITWLLLGVVIMLTIAVIALVFALIWNCHHHNPASSIPTSSASIGQRPKSTNLDLQGQCPLIPTHRYSLVAQVVPPVSQRKCNELVDVVVKSDDEPTEELNMMEKIETT